MTTKRKWWLALAGALAMQAWTCRQAVAANPGNLTFTISFTGALSVEVDNVQYSSRSVSGGANAHLVAGTNFSSSSVKNDGTITETWQLYVTTITNAGVTGVWANAQSTTAIAADQYGFQALFVSSVTSVGCPADAAADWNINSVVMNTGGQNYTNTLFADANFGANGTGNPDDNPNNGDMNVYNAASGLGLRGLCTRIILPPSASVSTQYVRMTVTAVTAL